jgi:hypothetical protein
LQPDERLTVTAIAHVDVHEKIAALREEWVNLVDEEAWALALADHFDAFVREMAKRARKGELFVTILDGQGVLVMAHLDDRSDQGYRVVFRKRRGWGRQGEYRRHQSLHGYPS